MRLQPDMERRERMMEQQTKRPETVDVSRVDDLLGALKDLPPRDPSPALRERLELVSSARLKNGPAPGRQRGGVHLSLFPRIRPAIAVALLVVIIGLVALFLAHLSKPEPLRAGTQPSVASSIASVNGGIRIQPAARSPEARLPKTRHSPAKFEPSTVAQSMIVRLPYSDSAIITGTDTTIRVSMSQAELMSLGFPINEPLHDRRVVADLTLGDDGLPRAISVPLPLEVIKEKK
jgi:hypothetical protein